MKYYIRVRMDIDYRIDADNVQEAYEMSQNMDLPHWYVENSWDTQSIIDEEWKSYLPLQPLYKYPF